MKPDAPEMGEVESAVREAMEELEAPAWRKAFAVRLARELDQSSSSVAPMMAQLEKMMVELEKGGVKLASGSDGLPDWAGSRK